MSNFTPITNSSSNDASTVNNPLSQLDTALTALQSAMTAEISTRGSQDSAEAASRAAADALEIAARIAMVDAETAARIAMVDAETAARITAIANEAATRAVNDNDLDARIDALVVGAGGSSPIEVTDARAATHAASTPSTLHDALIWAAQDVYDIRAYGAVAGADSSTAINAAITAANAAGGGVVFVPKGTFILNAGITVKQYVHLRGAHGSVLQVKANTDMVAVYMSDDSRISSLEVDGNSANQAVSQLNRAGVVVRDQTNVVIEHLDVHHFTLAGIIVEQGQACDVRNNRVHDIYTKSTNSGSTGLTVYDSTTQTGPDAEGIMVHSNDNPGGMLEPHWVRNNTVRTVGVVGIDVRIAAVRVHVHGNLIDNIGNTVTPCVGLQVVGNGARAIVTGNQLTNIPASSGTAGGWPVSFSDAASSLFANNFIYIQTASNHPTYAIEVVNCQRIAITGNVVVEGDAFHTAAKTLVASIILSRASYCTVTGNILSNYTGGVMGIQTVGGGTAGETPADYSTNHNSTGTLGCWGNSITGNVIQNYAYGIQMSAYTYRTTITANHIDTTRTGIDWTAGEGAIVGNTLVNRDTTDLVGHAAIHLQNVSASYPTHNVSVTGNQIVTAKHTFGLEGSIDNVRIDGNVAVPATGASNVYALAALGAQTNIAVTDNSFAGMTYGYAGLASQVGWTILDNLGAPFVQGGTTGNRPVWAPLYYVYYDTTLNKPVWQTSATTTMVWKDSSGSTV